VKTFVCLISAVVLAWPTFERAGRYVADFQDDLRRNLSCTAATYAALDSGAEADLERAERLCAKTE
jgi:hypothetical protein